MRREQYRGFDPEWGTPRAGQGRHPRPTPPATAASYHFAPCVCAGRLPPTVATVRWRAARSADRARAIARSSWPVNRPAARPHPLARTSTAPGRGSPTLAAGGPRTLRGPSFPPGSPRRSRPAALLVLARQALVSGAGEDCNAFASVATLRNPFMYYAAAGRHRVALI
jgi:hypothetical protein